MGKGNLIVVEGTTCSGKKTQIEKLVNKLRNSGFKVFNFSFPYYDSPTGKIVGGPYLGKTCDSWFLEGATNVDALCASAYYAADRRYNIGVINEHLDNGEVVILDRYVESNMAHQGGKIESKEAREELYEKLDALEFGIMELPRPDAVIFLYMPSPYAVILRNHRGDSLDKQEEDMKHLENAEKTYLELTEKYGFIKVDCVKDDVIRTIEDISNEVYAKVEDILK